MINDGASLRGSGAKYQSDRLSLGRTIRAISQEQGPKQVIEKVVYKEDEELRKKYKDLKQKLNESLMRLIVIGADNERLNNRLRNLGENPLFQNNAVSESGKLLGQIAHLERLVREKDSEIA